MKERVWVVTGSMSEFEIYVRNKPLNGDKKYHYVQSADHLRGIRNPHGVLVGNWKLRDDIIQILDQLIITSDNPINLQDIKRDLIRNATAAVTHSAAVSNAAELLAKAIDQQVLDTFAGIKKPTVFDIMEEYDNPNIRMQTWQGFVK
jgi:hypothetical protein